MISYAKMPNTFAKPEDSNLTAASLNALPAEVLQQIVSDLPFDTVVSLIQLKDNYITNCILGCANYRHVFRNISSREDLETVAEILTLCYEVSPYRPSSKKLCPDFLHADRWRLEKVPRRGRNGTKCCQGEPPRPICSDPWQGPYPRWSLTGAKWDRKKLFPFVLGPSDEESGIHDALRYISGNLGYWAPLQHHELFGSLLTKVRRELQVHRTTRVNFGENDLELMHHLYNFVDSAPTHGISLAGADIAEGVHKYIEHAIQMVPHSVIERLEKDLKDRLAQIEGRVSAYSTQSSRWRKEENIKPSRLQKFIVDSAVTYVVRRKCRPLVIQEIEKRIFEVVCKAPACSYWFFHDYFNEAQTNLTGVLFGERDYEVMNDGFFWWTRLKAGFRRFRSFQLEELANLLQRYPHTLTKDSDPELCVRKNSQHIRSNILARAETIRRYNPFRFKEDEAKSLMIGPGLPLVPTAKHLRFFLTTLSEQPINLDVLKVRNDVESTRRCTFEIEAQLDLPKLTWSEEDEHEDGVASLELRQVPFKDNKAELEGKRKRPLRWKSFNYPPSVLADIRTALIGFLQVYRTGRQKNGCPRVVGSGTRDVWFSIWRDSHLLYNDNEIGEPFDQKDLDWLAAFLRSCEYLRKRVAPADKTIGLFEPYIESPEEQAAIKIARVARKEGAKARKSQVRGLEGP